MIKIDGLSNESLVLDGEWFEKLRGGQSKTRLPAATFVSADVTDIDRKKGMFSKEREQLVQLMLTFDGGPFVGFTAPAEKRPQVDELLAGLQAAKA